MTTATRNVAVGLVIAASNFAGTPAVTAVVAYGLVSILGALGCAPLCRPVRRHRSEERPMPQSSRVNPDTPRQSNRRETRPMATPRYPSLYQINTRVWLTELVPQAGPAGDPG